MAGSYLTTQRAKGKTNKALVYNKEAIDEPYSASLEIYGEIN